MVINGPYQRGKQKMWVTLEVFQMDAARVIMEKVKAVVNLSPMGVSATEVIVLMLQ